MFCTIFFFWTFAFCNLLNKLNGICSPHWFYVKSTECEVFSLTLLAVILFSRIYFTDFFSLKISRYVTRWYVFFSNIIFSKWFNHILTTISNCMRAPKWNGSQRQLERHIYTISQHIHHWQWTHLYRSFFLDITDVGVQCTFSKWLTGWIKQHRQTEIPADVLRRHYFLSMTTRKAEQWMPYK